MDALDDIVKEFLIESYENLDRLDQDLMALEEVPDDRNRLSSVFRAIHTIKAHPAFSHSISWSMSRTLAKAFW